MALYQNVFIGFPIPEEYHNDLQSIKLKIKLSAPHFKPASALNPHITGIFLGEVEEAKFSEIAQITHNEKSLPAGTEVTATKLAYFTPNRPRVVYLALDFTPVFETYIETLTEKLRHLIQKQERDQSFAPHITLGRNTTRNTQKSFLQYTSEIEQQVKSVQWKIPLYEIVLYGRNPYTEQKVQETIQIIRL